jgi:serine phosphatase RsbU (regulator of sigma subunit)
MIEDLHHNENLRFESGPAEGVSSTGVSIWSSSAGGASEGGDWCEAIDISSEVVALTIGDIAGHGDAVAEKMAAVRASVLHAIEYLRAPSDVLAAANAFVNALRDESIVTAIVAFYNRARRTLTYANAGHPPPLLVVRKSASFLEPARADLPLGVFANHRAQNYTIALPADSIAVFYTDGVTEHERDPIRGERELADAARLAVAAGGEYARAIAELVFRTGRGHDDAAVLALHTALAIRYLRDPRGHSSR